LPVLPGYIRGPLHASDLEVGIVVGAFAITSVVCRPLAGRQADRRGRRIVLVAGSSAMALGGTLYLLSGSVPSLVAARLVVGAGGSGAGATVFTAFAVAVFASRVVLSAVPDRAGARRTATAAGLLEALGLTIIALAHSLVVALLGALVVGIGFSMLFPSLALMVVGEVGADRRGSALGAFTAFFDIGVGLGGPLAGLTAALAAYPAVFVLASSAAGCAAALAATPRRRR